MWRSISAYYYFLFCTQNIKLNLKNINRMASYKNAKENQRAYQASEKSRIL